MNPRLPDLRPALVLMAAVLATWFTAWQIERAAGLTLDFVVLGTMMALTLGQTLDRVPVTGGLVHRAVTLAVVPVSAVASVEVGRLLGDHEWIGGAVFCLALGLTVWVRRFGQLSTRLGTLAGIPFVALLIAPPLPGAGFSLWPAVVAVVAVVFVLVARLLGGRLGLLARRHHAPVAPRPPSTRRVPASTSMALQLTAGLAAAYVAGRLFFPDHWPWAVLSCYVVHSGSRGRGDVVHKGILRLGGALVGTVLATVIASPFPAGDRVAVVLLFCVMAVAVWLRSWSYAFWAAGVTAMLALLQGYLGAGGLHTLEERLVGVIVGAAVAVAAAWYVVPIRSLDVFRRRWADALAAVGDLLAAMRERPGEVAPERSALVRAVAALEQVAPAFRFHRRTLHQWFARHGEAHPADLVGLLHDLAKALDAVADEDVDRRILVAWARQLGGVRGRMRPSTGEAEKVTYVSLNGTAPVECVTSTLVALDEAFTSSVWRRLGGGGARSSVSSDRN